MLVFKYDKAYTYFKATTCFCFLLSLGIIIAGMLESALKYLNNFLLSARSKIKSESENFCAWLKVFC